jgi:predicted transcriptional regulator
MLAKLKSSLREFYPYAKKRLGFDRPVRLFLRNDPHNAADVYGKTAYYDPQEEKVVLYVTNRHPKDILRSFAHELVHHKQNCDGRLSGLTAGEGYAQTEQGEQLEKEAYLGSMMFRNFEDTRRKQMTTEELKQKVENIVKEYLDEKKKMPDENKDGVPDFAQDGKGANDLGKGKAKPKKKKGGKVPSQLEPFVKGKKKDEDEKEEVDEGSCGKRDPEDKDKPKYAGSQDPDHDKAKERGAMFAKKKVNENKTPQPKPEQSNEDWYWGSLYGKLKDKWTK